MLAESVSISGPELLAILAAFLLTIAAFVAYLVGGYRVVRRTAATADADPTLWFGIVVGIDLLCLVASVATLRDGFAPGFLPPVLHGVAWVVGRRQRDR
jgi:hypothetical protein